MHTTLLTSITVVLIVVNARKLFDDIPKHENGDFQDAHQEEYQLPVDFKHLPRYGVGDLDFKQPFDNLHIRFVKPGDEKQAMALLRRKRPKTYWIPNSEPPKFKNARDELEYYKTIYNSTNKNRKNKFNNSFDFASILEKNIADPFAARNSKIFEAKNSRKFPKSDKAFPRRTENITEYFQDNRFYRRQDVKHPTVNWTTCDEFAKNAVFHPNDIVNTKWVPFFIWSRKHFQTSVVHTFSYPTKKNVQYFKSTFGQYYKNMDWRQPKLILNERRKSLLIAADRKGLFYAIPDQELPKTPSMKNITLIALPLRLKIHDPYLAMMYCDEPYAAILAELGTEPSSYREALLEAATLKFKGRGNVVRRDVEEETLLATMKQRTKVKEEENKFIRIQKPTGYVDEKVKQAGA